MEVHDTNRSLAELNVWRARMQRKPGFFNKLSKRVQTRVNKLIPEKLHLAITKLLKEMIKGVLFGAGAITGKPQPFENLAATEKAVLKKIEVYKKTGAVEGGLTGAGGFLWGLADFPLLLSIKIKMLFDIAAQYGFDTGDYKERVYLLHIFEIAFCSDEHRNLVYNKMVDWKQKAAILPSDINQFDWRKLQQEYRDYIDLAKMAQLIPVIGAAVGLIANWKLLQKLGTTAMNAYRMRLLEDGKLSL
ncbi:MAG: EcsC family protein [Ferruginibacter sp.]